jgi:Tfp pilus assembly protein PilZ
MRTLLLAFASATLWAQSPLEQWLGATLVILPDAPPRPDGEAFIENGVIYVPAAQLRDMGTPADVAKLLSHAAAHKKLNHGAVYRERMGTLERAAQLTFHFPLENMEANVRAQLEKEAAPEAAEFLAKSGCAPGPCRMFNDLLRAVRR